MHLLATGLTRRQTAGLDGDRELKVGRRQCQYCRAGRDDDDVASVVSARDVDDDNCSVTICLRVVVVRTVTPGCGCCNKINL